MNDAVVSALQNGDIKALEALIAQGFDIRTPLFFHGYHFSALRIAAGYGQLEMFEHLLAKKCFDLKEVGPDGHTILEAIVIFNHIALLEHCLSKKYFKINQKPGIQKFSLLVHAIFSGNISMLEHLLSRKYFKISKPTEDGISMLQLAAASGRVKMFEHLISKKYFKKEDCSRLNKNDGYSCVFYALQAGHVEMVDHLLTRGYSKINEISSDSYSLLFSVVEYEHTHMIDYLLQYPESDLKYIEKKYRGDNVLSFSAYYGKIKSVNHLLKRGAYIDMLLNNGTLACSADNLNNHKVTYPVVKAAYDLIKIAEKLPVSNDTVPEDVVAMVKILGENLNARRILDGNTALHLAIENRNVPLIKLLMESGADMTMPNDNKFTPLDFLKRFYPDDEYFQNYGYIISLIQIADKALNKRKGMQVARLENQGKENQERESLEQERKGGLDIPDHEKETIEAINRLQKISLNTLETLPQSNKEDLAYMLGEIFSKPNTTFFNPVKAYQFLKIINNNHLHFKSAQNLMAELLISGKITFQRSKLDLEQVWIEVPLDLPVETLSLEPAATQLSLVPVSTPRLSLDPGQQDIKAEREDSHIRRIQMIIRHLSYGGSTIHGDILGKFIAEYILGDRAKLASLGNVKGIDIESQLAAIDLLREKELEIRRLQLDKKLLMLQNAELMKKLEAASKKLEAAPCLTMGSDILDRGAESLGLKAGTLDMESDTPSTLQDRLNRFEPQAPKALILNLGSAKRQSMLLLDELNQGDSVALSKKASKKI